MRKITPYITEKSVLLTKSDKYTLIVDYDATKKEIISLVKQFYKVSPISVNILKTQYLKASKNRKPFLDRGVKKAIVQLEKGKKIAGFEFETKEDKKDKGKEKKEVKSQKVEDAKKS